MKFKEWMSLTHESFDNGWDDEYTTQLNPLTKYSMANSPKPFQALFSGIGRSMATAAKESGAPDTGTLGQVGPMPVDWNKTSSIKNYQKGYVPVYLSQTEISSLSKTDIDKLARQAAAEQIAKDFNLPNAEYVRNYVYNMDKMRVNNHGPSKQRPGNVLCLVWLRQQVPLEF